MRILVLTVLIFACVSRTPAAEPDTIQPGMVFSEAKALLKKHRCNISRCEMAMVIPKGVQLECGDIDSEMLLLVDYNETSGKILSLEVGFIPHGRSPKLYRVFRTARKIVFEDDETVTLSLVREQRSNESAAKKR